jgi:hypothetical protein
MDHQRPDPGQGDSAGARIEEDFVRPVKPMKNLSHRRLPAALPIAIAGLLVVTSVAFGARVISTIAGSSQPNATPVVIDDQPEASGDPTDGVVEPTDEIVEPTEAPAPVEMTLTATLTGTKVALAWSAYQGADFAYYKVVRSPDETVSWPLGENDKLIAAISDPTKLAMTDAAPLGSTFFYRVFAVKSSAEGYAVLGATNVATIKTPQATPEPVNTCAMSLSAKVVEGTVKLTWTKYECDHFQYYLVLRSRTHSTPDGPLPHEGTEVLAEIGAINQLTFVDDSVVPGATYYYRILAWNSEVFCEGGTVLARTNVVKVTIPGESPTAPPVQSLGLDAVVGADGSVHLDWGKYTGPYFEAYLVVRSETNTEPTNDNADVVAVIENVSSLSFVDDSVVPGHTYHYRVLAWTSQVFCSGGTILGMSPVRTVTIPTEAPETTPAPES